MIYDKKQHTSFNRRSLVTEIRALVKKYIKQTNDKEVESFEIDTKNGTYHLRSDDK